MAVVQGGGSATTAPVDPTGIDLTAPGGWQQGVLAQIGAPYDPKTIQGAYNISLLDSWAKAEGTSAQFNPLATTLALPGSTDFNSVGVKNYQTPAQGVNATARTLLAGFPVIVGLLRQGDAAAVTAQPSALAELNKWVTGKLARPGQAGYSTNGYAANITSSFYKSIGSEGNAADWSSFDLGSAAAAAKNAAAAAANATGLPQLAAAVSSVAGVFTNINTWRRVGLALAGVALIILGVLTLARSGVPSVTSALAK